MADAYAAYNAVNARHRQTCWSHIEGVEPTSHHAERSVRPLVIMQKICNGTRSAAGSESHGVLPSLLQTAQRQGTASIRFLVTLNSGSLEAARGMLFPNSS